MDQDDERRDEVGPDETRESVAKTARRDAPDPPAPAGTGIPRAVVYLSLLALAVLIAGYADLNRRMTRLERGVADVQTSVRDLPAATLDAILAYQSGQVQERTEQEQQASRRNVTIDDDAWLGDRRRARLAIVEFSDFNCPYCARFHQETLDPLIDRYVRDGRALYVYRDYVGVGGSFSHAAAAAAECVREQAGDEVYLTLVGDLFDAQGRKSQTTVTTLAQELELDRAAFDACVESDRYRQEVADDTQDGLAAGIRGTPGFIIGVLNPDGSVDGIHLPGAQPIAVFEQVIEQQLARLE